MMISPEDYYEGHLKGKSPEQILHVIRVLKRDMGRLKNAMESQDYDQSPIVYPNKDIHLYCTRAYLEKAKQAYIEAGGIYYLSSAEKKASDFSSYMDFICKITFTIGEFYGIYRSYVVQLSDKLRAYTELLSIETPLILIDKDKKPFSKKTFVAALADLHIGEWRSRYSTQRFGYMVYDGAQWELKFEYNNGHKSIRFSGDNSYPYNFNKFQMLFGIDDTEEEEEPLPDRSDT